MSKFRIQKEASGKYNGLGLYGGGGDEEADNEGKH